MVTAGTAGADTLIYGSESRHKATISEASAVGNARRRRPGFIRARAILACVGDAARFSSIFKLPRQAAGTDRLNGDAR